MKLSDFDYDLPKELIAQYPLKARDSARLLVLDRKHSSIEHRLFRDITEYLCQDDVLVLNNTRVLPSRLTGSRLTGGKVELLLLNHKDDLTFSALIRPNRLKVGERISFDNVSVTAELVGRDEIKFSAKDISEVYAIGKMPLPPYIKREAEESDDIYYQTVYAKNDGSIAAPTAGLHFTDELLAKINSCGIHIAYVTLHVGYATFKPVKAEDIREHKMELEHFYIGKETQELLAQARQGQGRVCAVGTTSLRSLEAYSLGTSEGKTDIFIYPGYRFKLADCLLTNFHLPRTTLFMLVCAFAGEKLIKKAYQEAIDKEYRFYSYGDAMLII